MIFTYEKLKVIGKIKGIVSYWEPVNKTLYIERQETKGVFIPIYKNEQKHLSRVLLRVDQRFRTWRKKIGRG
jgi:hypothetical protein